MRLTSPLNLPAPGRRQWLYGDSSSWQPPVFLLNSRLGRFSAASFGSETRSLLTYQRHPFSRSYGVILPSSFSTDHSSTLGFSPRLPVSVCGTVALCIPMRGFSRRPASGTLGGGPKAPHSASGLTFRRVFPPVQATPLHRDIRHPTIPLLPRPPSRSTHTARHGNLDPFPIAYASRPRLRGRLTRSG